MGTVVQAWSKARGDKSTQSDPMKTVGLSDPCWSNSGKAFSQNQPDAGLNERSCTLRHNCGLPQDSVRNLPNPTNCGIRFADLACHDSGAFTHISEICCLVVERLFASSRLG